MEFSTVHFLSSAAAGSILLAALGDTSTIASLPAFGPNTARPSFNITVHMQKASMIVLGLIRTDL